jgi:hypothetical protein
MSTTFDEMAEFTFNDEDSDESKKYKPFWKLNFNNDEEVLKWLVDEFRFLLKANRSRHINILENMMIYRGVQFSPDDEKTINDFFDISRSKVKPERKHKLLVNHLYDITETIVSRSTRNSPQPEVMPANSSQIHDRVAAKKTLQILNHLAYINRLSMKDIRLKRKSTIAGETYMSILWNKDLGDISPLWAEAKEQNFKNEDGSDITDHNGKKLDADNPLLTGEVELKMWDANKVLLEIKDEFDEVNYCFLIEVQNVDELKQDYKKAKDVKPMDNHTIFDTDRMIFRPLRNETLKITFLHKRTKYLPKGYEATFTLDKLLEKGDSPYEHKSLPIERLTDVDIEGQLHAESFYEQVKGLQWRHNQMSSDIITNQRLCAKPKWIVPKGRCNIEQLGNAITVVQFSGAVPPRLESPAPTPQEIFNFRREIKEEMEQISTVSGVTRRDPPSQVSASVAMRYMSELEAERISVSETKHNEFIRNIYIQMMSVAGTFYDSSDGRTMRIMGEDEDFEITDIEVSNLNKPYDVVIKNVGSLIETKSAKEARIFDLLDRKPDLMEDEQLIDILELGAVDKMTSIITESLRSAERENENFFQDVEVKEPAPYEQHITHWKTHVQKLQSLNIKNHADPKQISGLEEHIWGTEFLMFEKSQLNPTFQAELANLSLFPIYYIPGKKFMPSSKEQQRAIVQGTSNRGEQTDIQIGGDEPLDQISKNEQRSRLKITNGKSNKKN